MRTIKLIGSERPTLLYEFAVEGRGTFPVDMLRYDRCWPAATSDAQAIMPASLEFTAQKRRVVLRSHFTPTVGRWNSFGWRVVL